jgi:hypothetical protein
VPEGRRLLEHGIHYGTGQITLDLAVERARAWMLPDGSFPPLVMISFLVPVAALILRDRRLGAFPFVAAWVLLAVYIDPPFILLGASPSPTLVRLQTFRVSVVAIPLVYAAAAFALSLPARVPRLPGVLHDRARIVYRAACGVLALAALATYRPAVSEAADAHLRVIVEGCLRADGVANRGDLDDLVAFMRDRAGELAPHQFARAIYLHESAPNDLLLIGPRAGIPIATRGTTVIMFFLREQFFDLSPENLRRFAVRWIVAEGDAPLGDRATERRFGSFLVREIPGWDGDIAHVVAGEGEVRAVVGRDEIELELEGADRPALVEIGTGFYARWHAEHEGRDVPVCARPATEDPRTQRVLALWAPPGRTVLRADGPLPSDGAGIPFTLAAIALAWLAWPGRAGRARDRILAGLAPARPWALRALSLPALGAVAAIVFAALLARQSAFGGVARSLRFGGFFEDADVFVVAGGRRMRCDADRLGQRFTCPDGTIVSHESVSVISDSPVGWEAPTPGIYVSSRAGAHVEVDVPGRFAGSYLAACSVCSATLSLGDRSVELWSERTSSLDIAPEEEQSGAHLVLRAPGPHAWFALAERTSIDLDRLRDVPLCGDAPPR